MILEIALALTLYDIAWLSGDWQLASGTRCVEEHWTAPSSNMLVGTSRTVEGSRTVAFERVVGAPRFGFVLTVVGCLVPGALGIAGLRAHRLRRRPHP